MWVDLRRVEPAQAELRQGVRGDGRGGTRTAVPRAACCAAKAAPLNPLSESRSRGGGPAPSRSAATSRSFTGVGTMLQARTMRLPRPVLIASRNLTIHAWAISPGG
jgi:hypothetical protein